jgi:hypothetical protein
LYRNVSLRYLMDYYYYYFSIAYRKIPHYDTRIVNNYYRVSRGIEIIEYTTSPGVYIIFSISYGFFLLLVSHGSFGNDFLRRR